MTEAMAIAVEKGAALRVETRSSVGCVARRVLGTPSALLAPCLRKRGFHGTTIRSRTHPRENRDRGNCPDTAHGGLTIEEVCRDANVCEPAFYRWRRTYGRMEMAGAKLFKELEGEHSELNKMLADEMLRNRVLDGALKKVSSAPSTLKGDFKNMTMICATRVKLMPASEILEAEDGCRRGFGGATRG